MCDAFEPENQDQMPKQNSEAQQAIIYYVIHIIKGLSFSTIYMLYPELVKPLDLRLFFFRFLLGMFPILGKSDLAE